MNRPMSLAPAALLALSLLLPAAPALAWSTLGHRLVARVADAQLTPAARAEALRLLATNPDNTDPTLPGMAKWADELRDSKVPADKGMAKATTPWHYVNMAEDGCVFQPATQCRDGDCLPIALARQAQVLADRTKPDAAREQALKFVIHLAGDASQPMHTARRADKGGNDFQVNFNGEGTNLHRMWDYWVLKTANRDEADYAAFLSGPSPQPAAPIALPAGDPARWAPEIGWIEASCRIAESPGVYPDSRVLGPAYVDRWRPVAEAQVREGGLHLAQILNAALAAP